MMEYNKFLDINKSNKGNVNSYRIVSKVNDNKTCNLVRVNIDGKLIINDIKVMDIAFIVDAVTHNQMHITNPSQLKKWKYFSV